MTFGTAIRAHIEEIVEKAGASLPQLNLLVYRVSP